MCDKCVNTQQNYVTLQKKKQYYKKYIFQVIFSLTMAVEISKRVMY